MYAYDDEPICACSTPAGISGIALIRVSGDGCGVLIDKCSKVIRSSADYHLVSLIPGYTCCYGSVEDPSTHETIDSVVLRIFAILTLYW